MNFTNGDILKRKTFVSSGHNNIGLVLDADEGDNTVEVLLFDKDGAYTRRFNEDHATDLFEVDNG